MVVAWKKLQKKIRIVDSLFNIKETYKTVFNSIRSKGFITVEKEQSFKSGQYGDELKLDINGFKLSDDFAKIDIVITLVFTELKKYKDIHRGNLVIDITISITLDYKHKWGTNGFNKFLMKIYLKLLDNELKKKYFSLALSDVNDLYDNLKDILNEYKH